MTITPQGQLYLCKTPLENDYKNQLTFSNLTAQLNYFNSVVAHTFDNYTYIKKDNAVQVGKNIDEIIDCNYLFYRNTGFTNKWYFCFITNMEYVNENCTRITFETDCYQTWLFQIQYKPTFVEREHVNDDTIGLHILDEGLQLGEYVCNKKHQWLHDNDNIYTNSDMVIVIGATAQKDKTANDGVQTDGIYAGLRFYVFHNTSAGINVLNNWLQEYARNGISDAIKCMFMLPEFLTTGADREDHLYAGSNIVNTRYINHNSGTSLDTTIDLSNNSVDGYIPKNNKLLTYPYSYLLTSNNSGADIIYRFEDFYTKDANNNKTVITPKFRINSCMTPSGSIRLIPEDYKGVARNDIEGINMGKFPICNWDTDVYTNWLTQNGLNIGLQVASSALSTGVGVATGNPVAVASGILGVANSLGEIYKESMVPPQSEGNINSGDVITASGENDFHFHCMTIKNTQAKIIDDYFSMYGYKVNSVKVPNITGRNNWNYVKTINCNFDGNIPQTDLNIIKTMFNNGVTLWHNPSTIYNYSSNNDIIV